MWSILQYGYQGFFWDFQLRCNLLSSQTTNKHNRTMEGTPLEVISDHSKYPSSPPVWCAANTCSLSLLKPQAGFSPVNKERISLTVIVTYNGITPDNCVGSERSVLFLGFFLSEINVRVPSRVFTQTQLCAVRGYYRSALMCSSVIIGTVLCPIGCGVLPGKVQHWWPSFHDKANYNVKERK